MILNQDGRLLVELGGLEFFSSRLYSKESQYVLDADAITGWLDGPGIRRDATPRLAVDGDFFEPAYKSGRLVSITGTAVATNSAQLQVMRDEFIGIMSDGSYQWMAVTTENVRRYSLVGLEGKPSWVLLSSNVASFKVDLYAPDPRIYGELQTVNISQAGNSGNLTFPLDYLLNYNRADNDVIASVTNNGNTRAYPLFRVTGNFNEGFTVTDNINGRVTFGGVVTMQAPVEIDMATATATQNGVDKSTLLTVRDWFWVKPGETMTPTFIPTKDGTGWCDIIVRDTWI